LATVEDIYRVVCRGELSATNLGSVDKLVCEYLNVMLCKAK